jgi:SWI/SNF-related matrix-associated actin-dependent regulator 1 of chromatin subfamily A
MNRHPGMIEVAKLATCNRCGDSQKMRITFQSNEFRAYESFAQKDAVKAAGWRWAGFDRKDGGEVGKFWYTTNPAIAAMFAQFTDESCREKLAILANHMDQARDMSRAPDADIDIPLPEGLHPLTGKPFALLPYQRAGVAYALTAFGFTYCQNSWVETDSSKSRYGCLIADEPGLGKTVETAAIINAAPVIFRRVLIICPASLRLNWRRELGWWLIDKRLVDIANGDYLPKTDTLIINYDLLKRHADALRKERWDLVVADEAHALKNPKAQRTQYVVGHKLGKRPKKDEQEVVPIPCKRALFLTGSPILNRPVELWPLANFLDPATWTSWWTYVHEFCAAYQDRWGLKVDGASNLGKLQDILRRTIMVRRLKKDVLKELPPKRRQVIVLPANDCAGVVAAEREAWKRHEENLEALRVAVELSKASDNPEDYKKAVLALREGATLAFTEMARFRHDTAMAKLPLAIEHIRECLESGIGKLILFSHHHDVQNALAKEFGAEAVLHRGGLDDKVKQDAVDSFQNDPTVKVFNGSIKASGLGITLTAGSHEMFLEEDWSPTWITQCEDRAHRIGQEESLLIQHIVLEDSIDVDMAQRMIEKQEIIDAALDDPSTQPAAREEADIPVLPSGKSAGPVKPISTTPKAVADEAEALTPAEIAATHRALQFLAGVCDYAHSLDGSGYNRFDARLGHDLASLPCLSPKQAALGRKIVRKYKRQLEAAGLTL